MPAVHMPTGCYSGPKGDHVSIALPLPIRLCFSTRQFVGYVRAGLWHLVDKYQVSWADAIAVAGAAATQFLGGTTGFKLRVGRCDNNVANPVDVCESINAYAFRLYLSVADFCCRRHLTEASLYITMHAPPQALPAPTLQCNTFESYWDSVGLTLTEGLALMGSHCLVDTTNRYRRGRNRSTAVLCPGSHTFHIYGRVLTLLCFPGWQTTSGRTRSTLTA